MTPVLLVLAVWSTTYGFDAGTKLDYGVEVKFDGYLPVLGGNEGLAEISMRVGVEGHPAADGVLSATSEISEFEISFNGAKLPLGLANVTDYFPRTTIRLLPVGTITENDAPNRRLPVRLPGLDVRRFPDITYVPVEFGDATTEQGQTWKFTRDFGGAPMAYTCTAVDEADGVLRIDVAVQQSYTVLENDSLEVVSDPASAVSEVETTLEGKGRVEFDLARRIVTSATMENLATSKVKDIASGVTTERKLATSYKVTLKGSKGVRVKRPTEPWYVQAAQAARNPKVLVPMIQLAALMGLREIPRSLAAWLGPLRPQIERWAPGLWPRG